MKKLSILIMMTFVLSCSSNTEEEPKLTGAFHFLGGIDQDSDGGPPVMKMCEIARWPRNAAIVELVGDPERHSAATCDERPYKDREWVAYPAKTLEVFHGSLPDRFTYLFVGGPFLGSASKKGDRVWLETTEYQGEQFMYLSQVIGDSDDIRTVAPTEPGFPTTYEEFRADYDRLVADFENNCEGVREAPMQPDYYVEKLNCTDPTPPAHCDNALALPDTECGDGCNATINDRCWQRCGDSVECREGQECLLGDGRLDGLKLCNQACRVDADCTTIPSGTCKNGLCQ